MHSCCSIIVSDTGNLSFKPENLNRDDFSEDRLGIYDKYGNKIYIDAPTIVFSLLLLAKLKNVSAAEYIEKITDQYQDSKKHTQETNETNETKELTNAITVPNSDSKQV
jgi:hypothetical protein